MISSPKRRSGGPTVRRQPPRPSIGRGAGSRRLMSQGRSGRGGGPDFQAGLLKLRDRTPYIVGSLLLGVALGGLLALLFPNTIPTRWLARLSDFLFGWLAGAALAWIGALGLALLSQQMLPPGGWLWRRIGGAGAVVLAVLVADALDSSRPAGLIGRGLATWLQSHLGGWPTILGAAVLILAGATAASGF